jgi:hypothetical protein
MSKHPSAINLSVPELEEELIARLLPKDQYTEQSMREMVEEVLKMVWAGRLEGWALPALPKDAVPWESHCCLRQWRKILQEQLSRPTTPNSDAPANNSAKWILLLIRCERLKIWAPVSQHVEAAEGLKSLLHHKFDWNYPAILDKKSSFEPIERKGNRQLVEQSPHEVSDIEDTSRISEDILDIELDPEDDIGMLESVKEDHRPARELTCYRCREKGHKAHECTRKSKHRPTKVLRTYGGRRSNPTRDDRCDTHHMSVGVMEQSEREKRQSVENRRRRRW